MLVNILSVFRFAHGGVRVVEYRPASAVDLSSEVAEEAIREGWAEPCHLEAEEPELPPEIEQTLRRRRRR
jgi:hypothetical protein